MMRGALSRRAVLCGAAALGLATAGGLAGCESLSAPAGPATVPQDGQGSRLAVTRREPGVAPGQILFDADLAYPSYRASNSGSTASAGKACQAAGH